ncbi:hypothetical protein GCM10011594_11940 [Nakamurella endophytica]|uniref:NlpC/P60 domain-containing protein n=1 Tax=Nakamurella endophytica TaxID=1748367 RepID=A0A917SR97_9ACTN|nr:hypothetical protein GCM10011594_11940 [Nakamurella endophytica]
MSALALALLLGTLTTATAVPPPPPNPSDQEIQESQDAASSAAAQVGVLAGQVSRTQGQIDRLRDDMELKGELVKKAVIDVQLAQQDARTARSEAAGAASAAQAAGGAVGAAEQRAAEFAAASLRQGSVLGSVTALLDSGNATDLLDREQLLRQVSADQVAVLQQLQTSRNAKANLDSDARLAQDQAQAAQQRAEIAAATAEAAQRDAQTAFSQGQTQLRALQAQLDEQQTAYGVALSRVAGLKSQREQYETWLAEKKAEEERLRREAEQRAREAAAAAAAKAAAERAEAARVAAQQAAAERAQAAALAAERAAAAKAKAQQEAAAKAAAQRTAAAKAAAQRAAAAKAAADRVAAQQAAAERAAAERAAATKAAADRAALARSQAAKAAAEKAASAKAAQLDAARKAQERLAAQQAARNAADRSVSYADCSAVEAAHKAPLLKGQPGYRAALDRNGNGVACEVLGDSAAQNGGSAGTGGAPSVYYSSCADAELSGASLPIHKGDPGYRSGLDSNGNGVACETLAADTGSGSGSGPAPAVVDAGVAAPRDDAGSSTPGAWSASKGQQAVAAAVRWVGTPYSWGGGNSSGPTTGICGPNGAENDCNIVGFDCSGLTAYGWAQAGVSIPSYSVYQYTLGQHVSIDDLMPGDLLFYANDTSDPSTIHHVTMYMGNGQMVEAPYSGAYVHVTSAEFGNGFIGATRPGT